MPYIIRDSSNKIVRATVQPVHGAEMVAYDHPELVDFLNKNGQNHQKVMEALAELRRTDAEMSRAVEDVVMALFKKNILKMSDLPKPVQDRMAFRVKMRVMIQDTFDQASGHNTNQSFSPPIQPQQPSNPHNPYEQV